MAFRAKFLNREKVMARLIEVAPKAEKELAIAQMEAGMMLADRIKPRAPRRTGRYQRSIHADRIVDNPGAQGSLVGIRATTDKNAVGIFALFYWRFLEFGTVRQPAQPHIFPTYRAARKVIRRKMANAVNKVIRQIKKGSA
jgi:HK97 gp10 family phage protein